MRQSTMDLLHSSNPEDRRHGIQQVIEEQDTEALKRLMQLFKSDSDSEVRELALHGINSLSKSFGDAQNLRAKLDPKKKVNITDTVEVDTAVILISNSARKRADRRIEAAQDALTVKDQETALTALAQALQINPNLRHDESYKVLLSATTGMESKEAMALLENVDRRRSLIHGMRRRTQHEHQREADTEAPRDPKTTWRGIVGELVLSSAILLVGAGSILTAVQQIAYLVVQQIESSYPALTADNPIAVHKLDDILARHTFAQFFAGRLSFMAILQITAGIWLAAILVIICIAVTRRLLRHRGSVPYSLYQLAKMYRMRLVLTLIIGLVGISVLLLVRVPYLSPAQVLQVTGVVVAILLGITIVQSLGVRAEPPLAQA